MQLYYSLAVQNDVNTKAEIVFSKQCHLGESADHLFAVLFVFSSLTRKLLPEFSTNNFGAFHYLPTWTVMCSPLKASNLFIEAIVPIGADSASAVMVRLRRVSWDRARHHLRMYVFPLLVVWFTYWGARLSLW